MIFLHYDLGWSRYTKESNRRGSYDNLPELEHFLRLQQSGEVFMVVLLPRVLCVALEGIFLKIFR